MQDSFQEPKGVPDETATPKPVSERRRPFSIPCNLLNSYEFSLDQGRK